MHAHVLICVEWMCVYRCALMCARVWVCVGLRLLSGIFLGHSSPSMLRYGYLLNTELTISASLANDFMLRVFCFCLTFMLTEGLPFPSGFLFIWLTALWTLSLKDVWQGLYQLSHLPIPEAQHFLVISLSISSLSPHHLHWNCPCHLVQLCYTILAPAQGEHMYDTGVLSRPTESSWPASLCLKW